MPVGGPNPPLSIGPPFPWVPGGGAATRLAVGRPAGHYSPPPHPGARLCQRGRLSAPPSSLSDGRVGRGMALRRERARQREEGVVAERRCADLICAAANVCTRHRAPQVARRGVIYTRPLLSPGRLTGSHRSGRGGVHRRRDWPLPRCVSSGSALAVSWLEGRYRQSEGPARPRKVRLAGRSIAAWTAAALQRPALTKETAEMGPPSAVLTNNPHHRAGTLGRGAAPPPARLPRCRARRSRPRPGRGKFRRRVGMADAGGLSRGATSPPADDGRDHGRWWSVMACCKGFL